MEESEQSPHPLSSSSSTALETSPLRFRGLKKVARAHEASRKAATEPASFVSRRRRSTVEEEKLLSSFPPFPSPFSSPSPSGAAGAAAVAAATAASARQAASCRGACLLLLLLFLSPLFCPSPVAETRARSELSNRAPRLSANRSPIPSSASSPPRASRQRAAA